MSEKPIKITALSANQLAKLLSNSSNRHISEDEVAAFAEEAGLVDSDGNINLLEYAAFLVKELGSGKD